jgi:hypothetical protein
MKKLITFITALFFCWSASSQTVTDNSFYLYKSQEDFFSGKKSYLGKMTGKDAKEIKYKDDAGKKKKFSINDSAAFYFGCEYDNRKYVWNGHTYYLFAGGNEKAYCITSAITVNYDADGYAKDFTWGEEGFNVVYLDAASNIKTEKIEEILKLKPKLLEKYTAEKNATDTKTWRTNKFLTEIRYFKQYVAES